jgi:RHS repeat-associated protein
MDDKAPVAMIEARNAVDDGTPAQLIRFQFGNHIGSACLELNDQAQVISYEEYYPYGCTSYQAVGQNIKAAAKRYRYIGKERDEESGLYGFGARYYASWLCRWISCDPLGLAGGINAFAYVNSNPIRLVDPKGTTPDQPPDLRTKEGQEAWGRMTAQEQMAANTQMNPELRKAFRDFYHLPEIPASSYVNQAFDRASAAAKKTPGNLEAATRVGVLAGAAIASPAIATGLLLLGVASAKNERELGNMAVDYVVAAAVGEVVGGIAKGVGTPPLNISGEAALGESAVAGAVAADAQIAEGFVEVPGRTTVPATPEEAEMFARNVRFGQEQAVIRTRSGGVHTRTGDADSVPINAGPDVISTVHTHPGSKNAQFSEGDVAAFRSGRFAPDATHSVLGSKWYEANKILIEDGLEPSLEVVRTYAEQGLFSLENLFRNRHF